MDLKAILAANKSKIKGKQPIATRKPVDIAEVDRPYNPPETVAQPKCVSEKPTTKWQQTDNKVATIHDNISQGAISTDSHLQTGNEEASVGNKSLVFTDASLYPDSDPSSLMPIRKTFLSDKVAINQKKTENKPTTNWQQSDNKPATNQQQIDNKVATISNIAANKIAPEKQKWQQSGNQSGNNTGNKVTTNRQQSDNKLVTGFRFSELVGLQKDIVLFICLECKNNRSKITEPLTIEYIASGLKHSNGAVKTSIQRLEKKGYLLRVEFKNGRGGWSRYEIPDHIYHDALRNETSNKVATNRQQTENKVASEPATEPATNVLSSSSNLNKTTTTQLDDEWNFDITPYSRFGFNFPQLKQIAGLGKISAADVEQSLIEFCYDLDNNALPPIKTTKINFLMGCLRAGSPYVSEGFKNEQEATISEMARRLDAKRKKRMEDEFVVWVDGLSEDEMKKILQKMPTTLVILYRTYGISNNEVRAWFISYFMNNK